MISRNVMKMISAALMFLLEEHFVSKIFMKVGSVLMKLFKVY